MEPENWESHEQLDNVITVWTASLDRDEKERAAWETTLSADEKARADRFHFVKDRDRFVVGRGLLRELLGKYIHQEPAGLEFSYGPYGKPALAGANAAKGISFNLAHSGGLAVYAISRQRNLGIDVERIQPESAGEDIARRYFSAREVSDLQTLPPEERVEALFRCWTRKEAYLKALGTGLQTPLDSFSVSLRPGEAANFFEGVEPRWHLVAFQPAEHFAAGMVYDGAPCSIQYLSVLSSVG